MIESFVDLTYRGLPLGRRVKLAQVRPSSAYLEVPTPMPVGTAIVIATDEGLAIDATVKSIHEQTGGSDKPPGMTISPALGDDAARSWWTARVALPEPDPGVAAPPKPMKRVIEVPRVRIEDPMSAIPEPVGPSRSRPVTIQPRQTQPRVAVHAPLEDAPTEIGAPIRISEEHSVPEIIDDGKKTTVMDSIDPALLEQLTGQRTTDEVPVIASGEHKRTIVMDAVDALALGLETSASGDLAAASDEDSAATDDPDSRPTRPGGSVLRRRRQPKKR